MHRAATDDHLREPATADARAGRRLLPLLVHLAVGVGTAVVVNLVLPDDHPSLDAVYLAGIGLNVVAIAVGLVLHRPRARLAIGWAAVGSGLATYVAADALWIWYARTGVDPFPSFADTLFFAGMTLMAAGASSLAIRRDDVDCVAMLDTAIGSGAAFAVLWVLVVMPFVSEPGLDRAEIVVSGAYPLVDVLVVAAVLRLLFSRGRVLPAMSLLLGGLIALAAADVTYHLQELAGAYVEWGWLDLVYMVAPCLVGAGALHPSSARLDEVRARREPLGTGRFLVLTGSAITPLVLLAVGPSLGLLVDGPVVPVTSAVLVVLVVARTWTLMGSARRLAELRGQERLGSIIRNSSDAIVVVDAAGRITYASPSLIRAWAWDEAELIGSPLERLSTVDAAAELVAWFRLLVSNGEAEVLDTTWGGADGEVRHVSIVASDLRLDPDITGIVLTARDVTHRVALEDRLRHEAAHDALTRIANRRRFEDALAGLRDEDEGRAFVVFADIDDFKNVNDTYGHAVGDRLLHGTAARLTAMVRPGDIVARLGGDEFGVLLVDTDEVGAASTVARIEAGLREPIDLGGPPMEIGYSLGWARAEIGDHESALRRADLAMYEVKRGGGRRSLRFTPALLDAAERELDLRRLLADALDSGELDVHYQPIVEVATGAVVALEALMRWTPADRGPVSPSVFVPLAEDSGEIVRLGRWVLERSCADASGWPETGDQDTVVSVNVSPVQLATGSFGEDVARALALSGLAAHRLQLELTETVLADHDVVRRFVALRELGVRLAIDDFGTGYRSLGHLRHMAVDVVKIDRSFVTGASRDPSLLTGIVGLVHGLGATAVAEGVETHADHELLSRLGVRLAQGWLHGRPSPVAAFGSAAARPG